MYDTFDQVFAQTREIQRAVAKATCDTTQNMQPLLQESLRGTQEFYAASYRHFMESNTIVSEHTREQFRQMIENQADLLKLGSEILLQSVEQARNAADRNVEQARQTADTVRAVSEKVIDQQRERGIGEKHPQERTIAERVAAERRGGAAASREPVGVSTGSEKGI